MGSQNAAEKAGAYRRVTRQAAGGGHDEVLCCCLRLICLLAPDRWGVGWGAPQILLENKQAAFLVQNL